MITSFPKIFAIGTDYVSSLFDGPVEVTEKIDGSQFVFGKIKGELWMRSRGTIIHDFHTRNERDLFFPVIQWVLSIQDHLPDDMVFYGETLKKPKHNVLAYERVPKNHFMLFAVSSSLGSFESSHSKLTLIAEQFGCEVVPLLYQGLISHTEELLAFINKESVLGGVNAEGIVVKNYHQPFFLGGQPIPIMSGKYVSEAFKEVHRTSWSKENTSAGKWQTFKDGYKTEARWDKAIQHLREAGQLNNQPTDIGNLIAEIKKDIAIEEREEIKNFLWGHFGQEVLRVASAGFPEYYKKKLVERSFEDAKTNNVERVSSLGEDNVG